MSRSSSKISQDQLISFIEEIENLDETGQKMISDEHLQRLFSALVSIYARRAQNLFQEDQRQIPSPFSKNSQVTTTDAIVTASAMLKAFDLAAFEMAWFSDTEEWELK
jgi:hypothetical protein